MSFLRQFRSLETAGETAGRSLLVQAAVMLPLTALALRTLGFRRVYAGLDRMAGTRVGAPSEDAARQVERARHVNRYLKRNGPYHGNCLSRSLVLWWLLRRRGIACDLRIGTRKRAGEFQAHAWVEYLGRPLNAGRRVRQRYAAFDEGLFPEGARKECLLPERR